MSRAGERAPSTSRRRSCASSTCTGRPAAEATTSLRVVEHRGVLGAADPLGEVAHGVADDENDTAGGGRRDRGREGGRPRRTGELEVHEEDEVVGRPTRIGRGWRSGVRGVRDDGGEPSTPTAQAAVGDLTHPGHGDGREVRGDDVPPLLHEPERVTSLAGGDVERGAGRQGCDQLADPHVGPGRPHEVSHRRTDCPSPRRPWAPALTRATGRASPWCRRPSRATRGP